MAAAPALSRPEHARSRALRALLAQHEKLLCRDSEIEHLQLIIAKLRRMMFGTKSEKVAARDRAVGVEARRVGDAAGRTCRNTDADRQHSPEQAITTPAARAPAARSAYPPAIRGRMPAVWRRVAQAGRRYLGDAGICSGQLQGHPPCAAQAVLHEVRCDRRITAPSRPIDAGLAGPGLLAHVLVCEVCRSLAALSPSGDLCARRRRARSLDACRLGGSCQPLLTPLVDQVRRHVLRGHQVARRRHAGPGACARHGQDEDRRLWTYVSDDRPGGDDAPPAVWFAYSEDRRANIRSSTYSASPVSCKLMAMPASIISTNVAGL